MLDFIALLKDTPLPTLLVVGGFVFLFLGLVTIKKPIVIEVTSGNRRIALILGIILIGSGFYVLGSPASEQTGVSLVATPTIFVTETSTPAIAATDTLTTVINTPPLGTNLKFIVISEVLGNPCGADSRNEFVELYNSGISSVDVSGLWITDGDETDALVAWQSRYLDIDLGPIVTVDTTIIPSHAYAVILAPGYPFVKSDRIMPYKFPKGTIILTVSDGQFLGDESHGIEASNRDVIVLYKGNKSVVEDVISTYGSPVISSSPSSIRDDGLDAIPFWDSSVTCWSVERIIATNIDIESNWEVVQKSSPGTGNYP